MKLRSNWKMEKGKRKKEKERGVPCEKHEDYEIS